MGLAGPLVSGARTSDAATLPELEAAINRRNVTIVWREARLPVFILRPDGVGLRLMELD